MNQLPNYCFVECISCLNNKNINILTIRKCRSSMPLCFPEWF